MNKASFEKIFLEESRKVSSTHHAYINIRGNVSVKLQVWQVVFRWSLWVVCKWGHDGEWAHSSWRLHQEPQALTSSCGNDDKLASNIYCWLVSLGVLLCYVCVCVWEREISQYSAIWLRSSDHVSVPQQRFQSQGTCTSIPFPAAKHHDHVPVAKCQSNDFSVKVPS